MPNPVPPPNVRKLTSKFTRAELLEKGGTFSFREARRRRGPVYEALISELYEDGCTRLANQFRCLVKKEQNLLETKAVIRALSDEPELLFHLFENFRAAELIKLNPNLHRDGLSLAVRLLYQCISLVEKFTYSFNWLLIDMYEKLAVQLFSLPMNSGGVMEFVARFRYKYGKLLAKEGNHKQSIDVLSAAQDLSKAESWTPDTYPESKICKTLHEAVARELGATCLLYATQVQHSDPAEAMVIANKALIALAKVGIEKNKELVFRAYLAKIDFLMQMLQYDRALKENAIAEKYIKTERSPKLLLIKCELLMRKGICYYNIKNKVPEALVALKSAFAMCVKYEFRSLEAKLLLCIGQIYASTTDGQAKGKLAFEAAKRRFATWNDPKSVRLTDYMIAKVEADALLSPLMQMIKSKQYCDFHRLRQWKYRCEPFWEKSSVEDYGSEETVADAVNRDTVYLYKQIMDGVSLNVESSNEEIVVGGVPLMDAANITDRDTYVRWGQEITTDVSEEYSSHTEWEGDSAMEGEESSYETEDGVRVTAPATPVKRQVDPIQCLLQEH